MNQLMYDDNDIDAVLKKHGIGHVICGAQCGNGWVPHIDKLITELIAMGWDKNVTQIKEKFGTLRFYVGKATPEMYELINKFEGETFKMCEACGKEGVRKAWRSSWIKCLCTEHGTIWAKEK